MRCKLGCKRCYETDTVLFGEARDTAGWQAGRTSSIWRAAFFCSLCLLVFDTPCLSSEAAIIPQQVPRQASSRIHLIKSRPMNQLSAVIASPSADDFKGSTAAQPWCAKYVTIVATHALEASREASVRRKNWCKTTWQHASTHLWRSAFSVLKQLLGVGIP